MDAWRSGFVNPPKPRWAVYGEVSLDPIKGYLPAIEAALRDALPEADDPAHQLNQALRYTTLGGGKRLRPALVCATSVTFGGTVEGALPAAVAIELIHAYSLVHDDLPAMDDDDLRRGRPTCHVAFDEATAILVGDSLQALAFETLAGARGIDAATGVRMVRLLAAAAGWRGMTGGQAFDMAATAAPALPVAVLRRLHAAKTGALFRAATQLGALCAEPTINASRFEQVTRFGETVGTAFQITDDVLDATSTTATLGKRSGADAAKAKNTYPALLGVAASRTLATQTLDEALGILADLGYADGPLAQLARATVHRIR